MSIFKHKEHVSLPEVVYELKAGGVYIIEYQENIVPDSTIKYLRHKLEGMNIKVYFVPNPSKYRIFEPVPATPGVKL